MMVTCLTCCIDKELWKAIDHLKEQVRVLKEQHNRIIEPQHEGNRSEIICVERLGGLVKSCHRKAA